MKLRDLDELLTPFEARQKAIRRLETMNELENVARLEIKLVGIGRDETGTSGSTNEVWLQGDEARAVIETAMSAIQLTIEIANRSLVELGVEIEDHQT